MRTLIIISAVAKQYSPASAFLYGIYNVSTNTNVSETACARHFVFPCPEKQNVLRQSRSPKPPRSGPDGGLASSGVRKAFCFSVSGKTKCSAPITLTQAPAKRSRWRPCLQRRAQGILVFRVRKNKMFCAKHTHPSPREAVQRGPCPRREAVRGPGALPLVSGIRGSRLRPGPPGADPHAACAGW